MQSASHQQTNTQLFTGRIALPVVRSSVSRGKLNDKEIKLAANAERRVDYQSSNAGSSEHYLSASKALLIFIFNFRFLSFCFFVFL